MTEAEKLYAENVKLQEKIAERAKKAHALREKENQEKIERAVAAFEEAVEEIDDYVLARSRRYRNFIVGQANAAGWLVQYNS